MQCPFLRKVNVKYCGLCRATKIPLQGADLTSDRCSSAGYRECGLVRERHDGPWPAAGCPYLSVGDVHYCDAAPFQKMIPCNQAAFSRCTNDGHHHCRHYLSMAEAERTGSGGDAALADCTGPVRDGGRAVRDGERRFFLPEELAYAPNHLWLDRGEGGACHIGVDAFFVEAVGRIDEVIYPQHDESRRPLVRFRVGGVDFDLLFPNILHGTEINPHLMADPQEVLRDPYGRGWIFEGMAAPGTAAPDEGLLRGMAARNWMSIERDRLTEFVHAHAGAGGQPDGRLMQDGGAAAGPLAELLDRRSLVRLHSEFFTTSCRRTVS